MNEKQKSIIAMLISAAGFSLMALFVKKIGTISVLQKTIFRTGTILIISYFMMIRANIKISSIKNHKFLLTRSILGTVGIVLNYYAIDHMILSDANVIFRLSTVFLIIFSFIFLKEKINLSQILTIFIAFIGILFIIKPKLSFTMLPFILAILGSAFAALAYTVLRVLGTKEHPLAIVFYFSSFTTLALLPYIALNFEPMTFMQITYAILAGVCATAGQIGVTIAYKLAPAKEVSIYNYSGVIFSAIFSIAFFGVLPDKYSVLGYFIVFSSSYYMYIQNKKTIK